MYLLQLKLLKLRRQQMMDGKGYEIGKGADGEQHRVPTGHIAASSKNVQ